MEESIETDCCRVVEGLRSFGLVEAANGDRDRYSRSRTLLACLICDVPPAGLTELIMSKAFENDFSDSPLECGRK